MYLYSLNAGFGVKKENCVAFNMLKTIITALYAATNYVFIFSAGNAAYNDEQVNLVNRAKTLVMCFNGVH